MRCKACGHAMVTHTVARKGRPTYFYYFCQTRYKKDSQYCTESKCIPAVELETRVWDEVSGLMKSPETLAADLERMIELEKQDKRGDPDREAKVWLDKLAEVDQERRGYLRLAAKGHITDDELAEELAALDETRATAERELEALQGRRKIIEELERDRDALLEYYAGMVPEALDGLTPEERHQIYKMLKLEVTAGADGTIEVTGALGASPEVCELGSTY